MRLNLGCGDDIRAEYVNVDFRQTHQSVMNVDLSRFPWPFDDNSAEEILMLDFLEHFPYAMTDRILMECYRTLRMDGTLVVQVPDGAHLTAALAQKGYYLCNACGGQMCSADQARNLVECMSCHQSADAISEAAMRRLYGGQDYAGNFHQTCFTQRSLWNKAASCGFTDAQMEEVDHQFKNWNLKMRLRKGDIWK